MHPDKKVGLALGILLIGITGAFFFRNEAPSDETPAGQLTSAESLDRRIDRSGSAPYAAADLSDETPSLPDVPEIAVSDIIPDVPAHDPFSASEPLPDPLRPADATDVLAPLPRPDALSETTDHPFATGPAGRTPGSTRSLTSSAPTARPSAAASDTTSSSTASTSPSTAQSAAPAQPAAQIHEVVAGDNLSSLAQQYLGSQSKYLKLYEANRDILNSPDDLRIGMRLKIPAQDTSSPTASRPTTSAVKAAPAATRNRAAAADAPVRVSKQPAGTPFVKPAKSPVTPRGRQTTQTGKSVGQTPPPNLPRVEGLLPEAQPPVIASRPSEKE